MLITSLIINGFSIQKIFGKLRLRAFQPYHQILCILKHVEDVEDRSSLLKGYNAMYVEDENTHTFLLITSLIINGFSIRKNFGKLRLRAFQPYHQILCILKHAEDVKDRSHTPKGCNTMYVEDYSNVKSCSIYRLINFSVLSFISLMFLSHVEDVEGAKIHSIECMCEILYKRSKQCQRCQRCLLHALCKIFQ